MPIPRISARGPDYVLRVLNVVARADCHDDIWWRTDGEYAPVTFWVQCSDVFVWGTADMEDLTEETLPELERAYRDVQEATGSTVWGATLYCARQRKMRPQGAAYPKDGRLWPLLDACGPAREPGLGNPRPHPSKLT
jgi:hypothetical protein